MFYANIFIHINVLQSSFKFGVGFIVKETYFNYSDCIFSLCFFLATSCCFVRLCLSFSLKIKLFLPPLNGYVFFSRFIQ